MKNNVLILAILSVLLLSSCGEAPKVQSDVEKMKLKGPVKQMTEFVVRHSMQDEHSTPEETSGEKSDRTDYDVVRVHEFSAAGRYLTSRATANESTFSQKYMYDKDSVLVMLENYKDSVLVNTLVYKYSMGGALSYVTVIDPKTKNAVNSTHFEYSPEGWVKKEIYRNADGVVEACAEYQHDKHGNRIKVINTNGEGQNDGMDNVMEYDEHGRMIKSSTTDVVFGGETATQEYRYTKQDKYGNWVKAESTFMGILVEEVERQYEYYE